MGNYDVFLDELHAFTQRGKPAEFKAGELASHQREFSKAVGLMRRLADARAADAQAKPAKAPVPAPSEVMAKAHELFQAGRISGEQLRGLEAHRNALVDGLAQRGAR